MSINILRAKDDFKSHFGFDADIVARAPGRVNIIGEHTDYNGGFVLPMALECETVIIAKRREDSALNAYAADLNDTCCVDLANIEHCADSPWINYVLGTADELAKLGKPLIGADIMIRGDVPLASGLSSSASLETAALVLFETLGDFTIEGTEAPKLCQRAENLFVGLNCGIMDQFIIRLAKKDHALFLDCRNLNYEAVPVAFENQAFVIGNTCVSRGLSDSKYNERVSECTQAAKAMAKNTGENGQLLRDFTLDDLNAAKGKISEVVFRRAQHAMSEDIRTKAACQAMRDGDPAALGKLMNESHYSLRDDYEVSCDELDAMCDIARALPGCYGSRMTGAGFGGCTVHLVEKDNIEAFSEELLKQYKERTGIDGAVIISSPAQGACAV